MKRVRKRLGIFFLLICFLCSCVPSVLAEHDLLGDVDASGKLDARDYMMAKRFVLGTYTLTDEEQTRADVNLDGKTNARDYMMIKRHVLGTFAITGGTSFIVVIDAGHQAKGNSEKEPIGPGATETKSKVTSGTTGCATGVPEYVFTLELAFELQKELLARGYDVVMIRTTHDVNISNAERAQTANALGADVFIRLHANGSENSAVHGSMTMCQTPANPYNGELYRQSHLLSACVVNAMCEATGFANKGVWETDTMSGINWSSVPVTIVEVGYMSNPDEDKRMQSMHAEIALGIADGIDQYRLSVQ